MLRVSDKPIVESKDDILSVLAVMRSVPAPTGPAMQLGHRLEAIRAQYNRVGYVSLLSTEFGWLGVCALTELNRLGVFDEDAFCELLLRKHRKYGAHPLRVWGPIGVIIRIHSKYERYEHVKEDPDTMTLDEGLIDTMMDILGYCVLAYIMVKV